VMLGSAVCGQIAAQELSYYTNLISSRNFRSFEAFLVAAGVYVAMGIALRQFLAWAGPRWLFGRVAGAGR
jgi:polar amino acid transport system permease protein